MPKEENSPSTKKRPSHLPLFNVVLMNDEEHSHEYVVEMLHSIFGYPVEKGFQMADEVDKSGRAIVFTAHREHAELKKEFIDAYGIDPRVEDCAGSMTAVLEPADAE